MQTDYCNRMLRLQKRSTGYHGIAWRPSKTRARGGKPPSNNDIELSGLCLGLSEGMEFQEGGPAEAEQARHFWNPAGPPKSCSH